jgi:D-alanyl-D-alanine carboxypeptidase (penicillin-binding protein 5/6)
MLLFTNYSFAADSELSINSEAAILIDSSTGKVLFEKNADQKMYPASTTKILTAILTLENCDLNDTATVSYNAVMSVPSGYSNAALQIGEELTIEQLLQVLLIHSANDAANVLAEHVGGSIESFATMMNTKAEELGCKNTHFTNPSGKHDENHYTTAYDLALITKYCMQNSTFRNIVSQKSCTIAATNKYEERTFNTTNDLLIVNNTTRADNYYYKYAIGVKTGYTSQAKNCLISASNKDGFELIAVVLGATQTQEGLSARYVDSKNLYEYGYSNYTVKKIKDKDDKITQIEISNATKDTKNLDLCISDDITALIKQSENENDILPTITINENLSAPIAKGTVVGNVKYVIDDVEYTADLVAANDVEKSTFIIQLIQIILLVIVIYLIYKLVVSNNKKKRKITY